MNELEERAGKQRLRCQRRVTWRHVPFRKVGTIKVRFRKPVPMKPRVVDIEGF